MGPADAAGRIAVSVVFSPHADEVTELTLMLDAGATLHDAIDASGLAQRYPEVDLETLACGIWGELRPPDAVLRDRDRVELYRPLQVDPKEGRRRRQQTQSGRVKPRG